MNSYKTNNGDPGSCIASGCGCLIIIVIIAIIVFVVIKFI